MRNINGEFTQRLNAHNPAQHSYLLRNEIKFILETRFAQVESGDRSECRRR